MKLSREPGYWRAQARQAGKALAIALSVLIPLWICIWIGPIVWPWVLKLWGLAVSLGLVSWDWLGSFTRLEWIAIIGIWLVLGSLRRISRQIDALRTESTPRT
ncbi:MAG: hypothetical protein ACLQOO_24630 [Terriglobia bacterium]